LDVVPVLRSAICGSERDIGQLNPAGIFVTTIDVQPLALLAVQKVAEAGTIGLPGRGVAVPAVAVAGVVQL